MIARMQAIIACIRAIIEILFVKNLNLSELYTRIPGNRKNPELILAATRF